MHPGVWVMYKDKSFLNCDVTLVYQWTRENTNGTTDEMGILVVQPKDPIDAHPFTKTEKLRDLDFMAFR